MTVVSQYAMIPFLFISNSFFYTFSVMLLHGYIHFLQTKLHFRRSLINIKFLSLRPMTLTGTSQKKINRWQISIWKDAVHNMSGKCKLKQQHTTTHIFERPKIQNIDNTKCKHRHRATRILIYCWWEGKRYSHFLPKLNILLTVRPSNHTPCIYP